MQTEKHNNKSKQNLRTKLQEHEKEKCIDDYLSMVGVALAQFNKASSTFIKTIVLCYFDSYAIGLLNQEESRPSA